ncbi:hypothetical protein K7432_002825 [Basidiobolus ranarum]|uniref:Uncharacterized protein n=1 Tax=Basidiobolus ranarum TaxID=34480 RepID=A0ABR2W755_9FUNG
MILTRSVSRLPRHLAAASRANIGFFAGSQPSLFQARSFATEKKEEKTVSGAGRIRSVIGAVGIIV